MGHKYETCSLVFYKDVLKRKCPTCTHGPLFDREHGVKKNMCTRFEGVAVPRGCIIIEGGSASIDPYRHGCCKGFVMHQILSNQMFFQARATPKSMFVLQVWAFSAHCSMNAEILYTYMQIHIRTFFPKYHRSEDHVVGSKSNMRLLQVFLCYMYGVQSQQLHWVNMGFACLAHQQQKTP